MKVYGLIGYPLTHSFSKKYFTDKFKKEGIEDCVYKNFELKSINEFTPLIAKQKNLQGLNVTIPYKQAVLPLLAQLDISAEKIGAVNVIKPTPLGLVGYNSDYYGFKKSLEKFLPKDRGTIKALILGTGGASLAVRIVLDDLSIPYTLVTRKTKVNMIRYEEINERIMQENTLIINTSPVGMFPLVDDCPEIPYEFLTNNHHMFDLVYNPLDTLFMQKGREFGAMSVNGLDMLHGQAEKAWEIWNS